MTTYRVTDLAGTSGTVIVKDSSEIAAAITPWYLDAPEEVTDAINALEESLYRPELGNLEALLGIFVEALGEDETCKLYVDEYFPENSGDRLIAFHADLRAAQDPQAFTDEFASRLVQTEQRLVFVPVDADALLHYLNEDLS